MVFVYGLVWPIKSTINKKCWFAGATNGISKNFETVKEVLKDFVDIHEPGKDKAPAKVCCLSV